jgi:hypothetical protein
VFYAIYYDKEAKGVLAQGHAAGSLLVLLLLSNITGLNKSKGEKMNRSFRVATVFSAVAVAILLFVGTSAQAVQMGNFISGEQYVTFNENDRTLVVAGLFDMMSFEWGQPIYADAADSGTRAFMARIERCIQGKTLGQLRQMLDQYFVAKPDAKRYNLASSFSAMLNTQCP